MHTETETLNVVAFVFTKSILGKRPSPGEKPSLLHTVQNCGSSLGDIPSEEKLPSRKMD